MSSGAGAGDPIVGRVLSGTYRIEARLGAGGMGAVYAARHLRTGKPYAVKVLLPEIAARRTALDRFRREAHALAALGHAHIVQIHDFDETPDGLAFLVMERLEGEDLATRLRRGPLPHDAALALADQIASALEAAHGIGLVHRDLKPGNVFLARVAGAVERAVLLDFGLAKSLAEQEPGALTSAGVVMGTPHYMSPEQAQGGAIDGRTDLWALGVILHEMLSGRPPFEGQSIASLFAQILTYPAPSLRARGVVVSDALESLLQRVLSKSPAERFPDATSFRRALQTIGSGAHTAMPPTVFASPATRATPASPARGARAATPLGNPFATTGTGRPGEPRAGTSRAIWIVLAALLALGGLGAATTFGLLFYLTRSPGAVLPSPPSAPTVPVEARPVAETDAGVQAIDTGVQALDAGVQALDAGAPLVAVAETPRPRTSRRREVAATGEAPSPPDPPRDPGASTSGFPIPPGFDTGAPGAAERIAARQSIQSGDWPGCLRALRGAPPTREVLWDRASCAFQARDRAELERACESLEQRFAGSPQASGCRGMLQAMAYQ